MPKKLTRFIVDLQDRKPIKRSKRGPGLPKFTLEEAFSKLELAGPGMDNPLNADLDLERGLRSVAFLLHSLSDAGNRDVAGYAAEGLGEILEYYAREVGRRAGRQP